MISNYKNPCGGGGIRTPDDLSAILVFKTSSLNRSDTPPITIMRRVPESNRRSRCFADTRVSSSPTRHAVSNTQFYFKWPILTMAVIISK